LCAFSFFKYGWLELIVNVPESLSAQSKGDFELELRADRTASAARQEPTRLTIASCRSRFATLPSISNDQTSVSEVTERLPVTASPPNLYATPRRVSDPDECFFYHTMDLPGYGRVAGYWDLRGNESEYLGNVALAGKRVLEIGPASGHLSFFMERAGAEVVSLEAGEDYSWELCWDMPDQVPAELPTELASHRDMMRRLGNSYWLTHEALAVESQSALRKRLRNPRRAGPGLMSQ
jgi:hypothetical protein